MIKEPLNADFYTTGREPSEQEFARISEWIKMDKQKSNIWKKVGNSASKSTLFSKASPKP